MQLENCASCQRLVHESAGCPYCGAAARAVTARPPVWAAAALCMPLLAGAACQSTKNDPTPAASQTTAPALSGSAPASAQSNGEVKADPPKPSQPMGEIYGTPEMMNRQAGKPEAPDEAVPAPSEAQPEPVE